MFEFLRGEADVLVATTIIESGLDIPQANTLVVERADQLGLAQAYQIRGRVGRSTERAFAYMLYPSEEALSVEAGARLATLSDHTELGSGFAIAMRDLELRGAGDLLGDEQSGHVAAVGFELYVALLDEAVEAMRARGDGDEEGEGAGPEAPVRLDVDVDAYLPPDYIPFEAAKIDVHRRIAGAKRTASCARFATSCATASATSRSRSRICSRCNGRGSSWPPPGRGPPRSAAGASRSSRSSSIRRPSADCARDPRGDLRAADQDPGPAGARRRRGRLQTVLSLTAALTGRWRRRPRRRRRDRGGGFARRSRPGRAVGEGVIAARRGDPFTTVVNGSPRCSLPTVLYAARFVASKPQGRRALPRPRRKERGRQAHRRGRPRPVFDRRGRDHRDRIGARPAKRSRGRHRRDRGGARRHGHPGGLRPRARADRGAPGAEGGARRTTTPSTSCSPTRPSPTSCSAAGSWARPPSAGSRSPIARSTRSSRPSRRSSSAPRRPSRSSSTSRCSPRRRRASESPCS